LVSAPAAVEQASQAPPLHAELQHTPSTQLPDWHWLPLWQELPLAWPDCPQVPEMHSKGKAQSLVELQPVRHAGPVPGQRYGEQLGEPGLPAPAYPLAGQLAAAPSQCSSTSQLFTEGRQTVPGPESWSPGQLAAAPVQVSCGSQGPAEARQMVLLDRNASSGQALLAPVHVSCRSHTSATTRQTVPFGDSTSAGQAALDPVQFS
jgi:hypothetical protein